MSKIFKYLIVFISGALVFGGGVMAYSLLAKDIKFTSNNPKWKANNVEGAINDLFDLTRMKANNYSTDEKVVGTWINGKPLYQKTIRIADFSVPNFIDVKTVNMSSYLNNVDDMIDAKLKFTRAGFSYTGISIYASGANTISQYIGFRYSISENLLYLTVPSSGSDYTDIYFTIQYTKTTDSAS